ncbi:mediator of RNA polymerase II transcription subunit 24-like protein [Leptotrombidium deliense]|uniref:Mediator of RNA polymerase II transcription subunit 24 n=1 Tax=Leptotrombidium deliense TaxID=299467 RepID=A0A443SGZ1_9ACAR|nr:mediator of RNA polymerase II transcription subunit 24-like protein [Leptotrombidium deliense]
MDASSMSANALPALTLTSSKTSEIKALLLQAWRERWDCVQWGTNIKKLLPRGVSGDVYDLGLCILQQSLIGPTPNQLFIDYLNHCITSQIVSYGAVLSAISKYQEMQKTQCILCLLNLVISFKTRIGCYGNEEECISLCKSIIALVSWLYSCLSQAITKSAENKLSAFNQSQNQFVNYGHHHHNHHQSINTPSTTATNSVLPLTAVTNEHFVIIEKVCELLNHLSNSAFLKAIFYVGKIEDPTTYSQLLTKLSELETKIAPGTNLNSQYSKETIETILGFVNSVEWNNCSPTKVASSQLQSFNYSNLNFRYDSIFRSLNAVIAFDAVLNPVCDIDVCAEQIDLISKFNDIPFSDLCCEIIRACFVGLVDAGGSGEDLKWAAFTFLKAPQLLVKLFQMKSDKKSNLTSDLESGLEKLLTYTPLLDLTDTKSNCDCLELFLKELCKTELLTEAKKNRIMTIRQKEASSKVPVSKTDQSQGQGASLILRAEPTVTSILKTLDSDYSKNQDALLGVLCHMVPGKSFELILNAAAATGKLRSFTTKLIKFNEFNKQVTGEGGKASQTRALLFDITFLMLCHIAQNYGTEIVTTNEETKDSFFATWCAQCLTEGGRYRCPDVILTICEANRVDNLLNQFTSTDSEFKTSLVKWHEFCVNAPAAIKEVLIAWEHEAISTDNVKLILDNVKSKMCCLPVVISAWLCSYINILHHDERLKPMNMLQQFMTPLSTGDASANNGSEASTNQDYYKERSTLMAAIIKKMLYDLHPPQQTKSKGIISVISHGLTSKTPLLKIMESNFTAAHDRSWLDLKSVHNMDTLLCVGGSTWFVDSLIRQLLKFEHENDLNRAVDLIFGLFHLDIEQCSLSLLLFVLKSYLLNNHRQEQLCEPKVSALARLTVMTIFSALNEVESIKMGKQRSGRKKHHYYEEIPSDFDPFESDFKTSVNNNGNGPRPPKVAKTDAQYGLSTLLDDTPFSFQQSQHYFQLNEPLTKSVVELLRLLTVIITDSVVSPRTMFPLVFLEQLVMCAKEDSHKILRFLPFHMIISLIKTFPETLTYEFLLAISNLETFKARKITARALCQLKRAKKNGSKVIF